jgi:hypothetical protein
LSKADYLSENSESTPVRPIATSRNAPFLTRYRSEDIINPKYTKNPIPATFIAQLPVLADLTIGSLGEELEDVETILEGLPPTNRLTRLTIDIMTRPREERLRPLGAACANMGCTVEVNLWRFMGAGLSPEDMAALVRAAFADLHERGRLVVRVRVDGGGKPVSFHAQLLDSLDRLGV